MQLSLVMGVEKRASGGACARGRGRWYPPVPNIPAEPARQAPAPAGLLGGAGIKGPEEGPKLCGETSVTCGPPSDAKGSRKRAVIRIFSLGERGRASIMDDPVLRGSNSIQG